MKISVVGEYYSSNLGDPVIVDSVCYLIKKVDSGINLNIVDLSAREPRKSSSDYTKRGLQGNKVFKNMKYINKNILMFARSVRNLNKWLNRDKNRVESYFDKMFAGSNAIIIAGGQLIMNNNLVFPLRLNSIIKYAKNHNIPVYFNACGVQKYYRTTLGVLILKKLLNDNIVRKITTRDDIDTLGKYVNSSGKIGKVLDSAVVCSEAYGIKKHEHSNVVGLGVIAADMYKRYADRTGDSRYFITEPELLLFWKNLIEGLNQRYIKWKIFTNGSEIDNDFAYKLMELLDISRDACFEYPVQPKELVEVISQYKTIISHRLHSHIISFSLGIPSIGLIWDKKTLDFATEIKREDFFYNIKTSTIDEIINVLEDVSFNHSIENQKYKENTINQIKEIVQDYQNLPQNGKPLKNDKT
jgi:polysaccharide pyruvyl transferase WcaK-like protein